MSEFDEPRTRAEMLARADSLEVEATQHDSRGRPDPAKRLRQQAVALRNMAEDAPEGEPDEALTVVQASVVDELVQRVQALESRVTDLEAAADTPADTPEPEAPAAPTPSSDSTDSPEVVPDDEIVVDYGDMTQAELEELLRARELPHSGTKAEQIARLEADDAEVPE